MAGVAVSFARTAGDAESTLPDTTLCILATLMGAVVVPVKPLHAVAHWPHASAVKYPATTG